MAKYNSDYPFWQRGEFVGAMILVSYLVWPLALAPLIVVWAAPVVFLSGRKLHLFGKIVATIVSIPPLIWMMSYLSFVSDTVYVLISAP